MKLWQRIKSRVSSWIRGGSSSKKSTSASSGTSREVGSRYRSSGRADRSYNVRRGRAAGLRSVQSAQERKQKERTELRKRAFAVRKGNYESIVKKKDSNENDSGNAGKTSSIVNAQKDNSNKSELRRKLLSKSTLPTHEERRRSNPSAKYKGGDLKERVKARGDIAKYNPKAAGYLGGTAEGLASAITFGGTDVVSSRLAKKDKSKATKRKDGLEFGGANYEKYADKKARKVGKVSGELAGSLLMFGGAGKAAEGTVAKGLSTKAGTKAVEKVAKSKLVRKSAEKAVKKGIKKGTIKAGSEELVKEIAKDKSKRLIKNLAENAIVDSTAGALYDFNRATSQHEIGSKEWKKEMRDNALINIGAAGVGVGLTNLKRNKKVINEALERVSKNGETSKALRSLSKGGQARTREETKKALNVLSDNRVFPDVRRMGGAHAGERIDDVKLPTVRTKKPRTTEIAGINVRKPKALAEKDVASLKSQKAQLEAMIERAEKEEGGRTELTNRLRRNVRKIDNIINKNTESVEKARKATVINNANPMKDDIHTGVRTAKDVKTFDEAVREAKSDVDGITPDFTSDDVKRTLQDRKVTVYSSKPIEDGAFVTPSKMEAENYAGGGKVYSREVDVDDVAWVDSAEGQYAPRKKAVAEEAEPKSLSEKEKTREKLLADRRALQERYEVAKEAGEDTSEILDEMQETDLILKDFDENVKNKNSAEVVANETEKVTPPTVKSKSASETNGSRIIRKTEDMVGKSRQKASKREAITEFAKSARTKFADSLAAFEDEARKKAKTDHKGMLDDYGAINKFRSFKTQANRSLSGDRQLKWDGTEFADGKTLSKIFSGMTDKEEKAFNAYLLLKHAPDRLREGKSIFKDAMLEDGRLYDDLSSGAIRDELARLKREYPNVNFEERAEDVYTYIRNELQNRVDAGLLPKSVADEWHKKYPFYVPTGREGYFNGVHGDTSAVTGAGELKAAKGSDYNIWDIKQQLADSTTRNWRDMSMNNMFRRMFGDKVADNIAGELDGGLETVLDNTINLSKSREKGKFYADVFIDGEKKRVEIDKRFYDAIEDMYKNGRLGNGIDVVNDSLSKVAGIWKNLITEWSPIFMVKNFLRDFPEAIINTRQTKEFLQCMRPALNDLINNGEYTRALKNSGISQSTFMDIDRAISSEPKKGLLGLIEKGNQLTEMYPRLVEYMAAFKKAGVDLKDADMVLRDRAAAEAADVTVNFGRSGSVGKMLNRGFVPFFNPSVQGWSKFIRNITELDGAKSTLEFFAKATALGTAPLVLSNFLYKDNPNYQMISARDKANNYIIAIPPTDENASMFIKIPRSRFASVYGLPLVNAFNDNKMGFAEAIQIANDQVMPVDPLETHFGAAFVQAENNKTWYGSPIVSGALEDLPPSEQYDPNTSYVGRAFGKATEKLPKDLQISPKKADYVIDATTGIIGDLALPALTPSRQSGGKGVKKYIAPMANVVKRQFSIDSTTQNNLSTRFYDALQDANTNSKSAKSGKAEQEEHERMNSYSNEVSKITSAIKDLQEGNRATKQEDIYGLQKVKNQLMQDAIDGKDVPNSYKTLDAVQKYVGTTYAINNFGSSADKDAMKAYGLAVYGNISKKEMRARLNDDKEFYNGVRSIGKLENYMSKAGIKGRSTMLGKAVALASIDANDDVFGAYGATKKSRTETANKMERARNYMSDGGSEKEFIKLEKARKTLGKLSDFDAKAEEDKIEKQLGKGDITLAEYKQKKGEIDYNANISFVGLATSLAQANAPSRGYQLYDIKAKNVQKGINLAAMGFTARDYREMAKAVDSDSNGYPSKKEIVAYVSNSDVEDKATLFDALYYYKGSRNPFGAVTNYSRGEAAKVGKANGVEAISNETGAVKLKDNEKSSGGYGYGGYRRGGYRRYRRRGGGRSGSGSSGVKVKASAFNTDSMKYDSIVSSSSRKSKKKSSKIAPPKIKVTPPKAKKYEI